MPKDIVEEGRMGKGRVKKFLEKPSWEYQWSEEEPFNPSYLKIDRIIDEGELDGVVHFLVKWCSQTYDLSTWEDENLVQQVILNNNV